MNVLVSQPQNWKITWCASKLKIMLAAQNKSYVLKQNLTLSWVTSESQLAFFSLFHGIIGAQACTFLTDFCLVVLCSGLALDFGFLKVYQVSISMKESVALKKHTVHMESHCNILPKCSMCAFFSWQTYHPYIKYTQMLTPEDMKIGAYFSNNTEKQKNWTWLLCTMIRADVLLLGGLT